MSHSSTEFDKIWIERCAATKDIREQFRTKQALDYLIGEKPFTFIGSSEQDSELAAELPAFVATIRRLFSAEEIRAYLDHLGRAKFLAPREPEIEDGDEEEPGPAHPVLGTQELLRSSRIRQPKALSEAEQTGTRVDSRTRLRRRRTDSSSPRCTHCQPGASLFLHVGRSGELVGYVAAEANHTKDKKLQKELDQLFARMETVLESYTDEGDRSAANWPSNGFFDALVGMFEHALKSANTLPEYGQDSLIARLDRVREISHGFGYGVGDDMDYLLAKYAKHSG